MTLPDDDPKKWEYSEHTQVKHLILDKYLKTWISIRGVNSKALCYVDGFAGKGKYNDDSPGSPIIAMRDGQLQIDRIRRKPGGMEKFICYFIEKNENNFRSLESLVQETALQCKNVEYELRHGVFEDTAREFIELSRDSPTIPMLYFIDPFGWDGVPFDIIKGILDNLQTEILFTFMIRDMNRFLGSEPHQNSLTRIFGGSSYESCIRSKNRVESLLDQYTTLIKTETKAKYVLPFMMYDSDTKRVLYYLIFASHHPLGLRKMKEVMKGVSSGDFGYLGPDHDMLRSQRKLEVVLDQIRIDWIQRHYKGRQISFEAFLGEVCPLFDDDKIGSLVDGDFRKLIRRMNDEGSVTIQNKRVESKAIEDKTVLTF